MLVMVFVQAMRFLIVWYGSTGVLVVQFQFMCLDVPQVWVCEVMAVSLIVFSLNWTVGRFRALAG